MNGGGSNHSYEAEKPFARSGKRKKTKVVYASHGKTAASIHCYASANGSGYMGKRRGSERRGARTLEGCVSSISQA
jgi:hypothetical protein